MSLDFITPLPAQKHQLFVGFHSLSQYGQIHTVDQGDDRASNGDIYRAARHVSNEWWVDLEHVQENRCRWLNEEESVPKSSIDIRTPMALRSSSMVMDVSTCRMVIDSLNSYSRDSGSSWVSPNALATAFVNEAPWKNKLETFTDIRIGAYPASLPGFVLSARHEQHFVIHFLNHSCLYRNRKKHSRQQHSPLRMMPPDQRFCAHDSVGPDVHLRLVIHEQLVMFQRFP